MKTIQLDDDLLRFLASKATDIGEPASSILRRVLQLPPLPDSILVDDDVYNFLVSKMQVVGESAADIIRRQLQLPPTGPVTPPPIGVGPKIVEFHIPAGTSSQPWNTRATTVTATVGDTLRLFNDDAMAHRLHTDGTPFLHPASDIPAGASADFLLQFPYDLNAKGPLTDHDFAATGKFFISVVAPV